MNKLIITGNLGSDPEARTLSDGKLVCNFSVAVQSRKDEDPTWVRVSAWNKTAELCKEYLSKGRKVLVEGPVRLSTFESKDGQTLSNLEMMANSVEFLTPREATATTTSQPVPPPQGASTPSIDEIPF